MIEVTQGARRIRLGSTGGATTVLELLARTREIVISAPCGGRGRCGKCVVTVGGATVAAPSAADGRFFGVEEIAAGRRLACTCPVAGVARVEVPPATVTAFTKDGIPEFDSPPEILEEARAAGPAALAVDIGTTTVAAYRVSTGDGEVERVTSEVNRQTVYGSDVLSRISYSEEHPRGLEHLAQAIRNQIAELWHALGMERGLVVVAANTTMLHLLAGESPASIGRAPFTPRFLELRRYDPADLTLPAGARVMLLPSNAGYVGADIMSAAVACDLDRDERTTLLVDIGTNGELVLAHDGRIMTCSTAAGPAFEGATISCGVGGVAGAITSWERAGDGFRYRTIADDAPIGICGPGLLDVVATLLDDGVVDETGRMEGCSGEPASAASSRAAAAWRPRLATIDDQPVVRLAGNVAFTQRDVREVQLAKAAIAAGIDTLCERSAIAIDAIERVVLTGGFGGRLRVASARRIGLLPALPTDRFEVVENAAGRGAVRVIREAATLARIERLAGAARYLELSGDDFFQERYIERMLFPEPGEVA